MSTSWLDRGHGPDADALAPVEALGTAGLRNGSAGATATGIDAPAVRTSWFRRAQPALVVTAWALAAAAATGVVVQTALFPSLGPATAASVWQNPGKVPERANRAESVGTHPDTSSSDPAAGPIPSPAAASAATAATNASASSTSVAASDAEIATSPGRPTSATPSPTAPPTATTVDDHGGSSSGPSSSGSGSSGSGSSGSGSSGSGGGGPTPSTSATVSDDDETSSSTQSSSESSTATSASAPSSTDAAGVAPASSVDDHGGTSGGSGGGGSGGSGSGSSSGHGGNTDPGAAPSSTSDVGSTG